MILLYMEKAFDIVSHVALLHKLNKIQTPSTITKSYVEDRKMYITVKDSRSTIYNVKAGVSRDLYSDPHSSTYT